MNTQERARQQAKRIEVRDIVAQFPVHLDTPADLEQCIAAIVAYGDEREQAGRMEALEEHG